jgi:hypothetical protein
MPGFRSSILIFACAFVAGGCGAAATVFDPADLRAPTADRAIRLEKDYLFENRLGGINNVLARATILSGRYQAEYEDAAGAYFRGPKGCFRTVYVDSAAPGILADCGIYLPDAKDLAPRIYVYTDGPPPSANATDVAVRSIPNRAPIVSGAAGAALGAGIVDAVIASEQNKPRFMGAKLQPPGPAFRVMLKAE